MNTERRDRVYNAIIEYMLENGYPPSVREIGDIVGLKSTSSVHAHLSKLCAEGRISMGANAEPRTIQVPGVYYVDNRSRR